VTGELASPCTGVHRRIDSLITESRIQFYASGVAQGYILGLAIRLFRHRWVDHPGAGTCTDFIWIWLASKFALASMAFQAYDYSRFSASRPALVGGPSCLLEHFDYPPILLLFIYPLGLPPYWIAFVVWITATLCIYLGAVYAIMPRWAAVLAALAPPPVFFNVLLGHNGFLTAGLIGLALATMERRPSLSGLFVGLLTYKPQFAILFPLALIFSRHWRALTSAVLTSVLLATMAAIVLGWQTWPAFIGAMSDRASSLSDVPELNVPLVSIFGVFRTLSVSAKISWTAQLAITMVVAATVCTLWARPVSYSLKAAALAIGSLLASPHVHGYDVCILTIGVAFLVRDGLSRGFLPGERAAILACWAGLFLLTGPIPPIICVVLLVLSVRRAVRLPGPAATVSDPLPMPRVSRS
jgi:Glycosyltransferase family 87